MAKVTKKIVIFPQKFKSVTLEITEAESFTEADTLLRAEVARYVDLLEPEDVKILERTLGGKI